MKKKVLSFLLAVLTIFGISGCSKENDEKEKNDFYYEYEAAIENGTLEEYLKSQIINTYYDYFMNSKLEYKYKDEYPDMKKIDKIFKHSDYDNECNYEFDGDIDSLVNTIKNNSLEYVNKTEGCKTAFDIPGFYEMLRIVIRDIIDTNIGDVNEDLCHAKSLIIIDSEIENEPDQKTLANYNNYMNIIRIDSDKIKNENEDLLKILKHEIDHMREYACEHVKYHGFSKINASINYTLKTTTLLESAAESYTYYNKQDYRRFDYYDYTYKDERKDEALIMLLGFFEKNSLDEYYASIFNSNLEGLFDYCGYKEDKKKLFDMLYYIDAINLRNDLISDVSKDEVDSRKGAIELLGNDFEVNVLNQLLGKLIKYTQEKNLDFRDNYALFNVIINVISQRLNGVNNLDTNVASKVYTSVKMYNDFLCEYYDEPEVDFYMFGYTTEFLEKYPTIDKVLMACNNVTGSYSEFLTKNGYAKNYY